MVAGHVPAQAWRSSPVTCQRAGRPRSVEARASDAAPHPEHLRSKAGAPHAGVGGSLRDRSVPHSQHDPRAAGQPGLLNTTSIDDDDRSAPSECARGQLAESGLVALREPAEVGEAPSERRPGHAAAAIDEIGAHPLQPHDAEVDGQRPCRVRLLRVSGGLSGTGAEERGEAGEQQPAYVACCGTTPLPSARSCAVRGSGRPVTQPGSRPWSHSTKAEASTGRPWTPGCVGNGADRPSNCSHRRTAGA